MSRPTVFTYRLEVERMKRGLSRQDLIDAVGGDLRLTPEVLYDILCPCPRGVSYHDHLVGQAMRVRILQRLATFFGMPESQALRLLDRV